ncbi:AraC family transcriptional regulator [Alkalibaculum sp. M08DMB]|uniref:AraC family transcriptional regulator n=1 Tax=Alkalibaculum sporogenes TaxID=2655001 RepID=A0A6A7K543_9FIRM|nr:GyrI-like domain-containing protein [Alkalibaculum sporogenes]MPW24552.1 AraC family transcriptional regulator [Alkalibaculum sporogenes]
MKYEILTNETKAQPTVSIRIITPLNNLLAEIEKTCTLIKSYLAKLGEKPNGPNFAAYYNWDKEKLDVEIGFTLSKNITGLGSITSSIIPAGKKVSTFYTGPYKKIAPAYKALKEYMDENGFKPEVNYEFYHNSIKDVPESALLTEIVYLVE